MLTHFVLTRFNAQAPELPEGAGLDNEWLTHRFQLFEEFCLPSMRSQRASAQWLVFFDARTPEAFISRVRSYEELCPSMEVVIVNGVLTDKRIAEFVGDRLPSVRVKLCTTRVDNDDAIGSDFIARVQAAAKAVDAPRFINFPLGFQWLDGSLYFSVDLANPFVSFAEHVTSGVLPQTVMCDVRHRDIATVAPVKQIFTVPMWIQVLHGKNVANGLRGVRRFSERVPGQFAGQAGMLNRGDGAARRGKAVLASVARLGKLAGRRAFGRVDAVLKGRRATRSGTLR